MGSDSKKERKKDKKKKEKKSKKRTSSQPTDVDDESLRNVEEQQHDDEPQVASTAAVDEKISPSSDDDHRQTSSHNNRSSSKRGAPEQDGSPSTNKKAKGADKDKSMDHRHHFFSSDPNDTFPNLPLSEKTQTALTQMNLTRLTPIQARALPALLQGKDLIGAAPTGSGKTLSFLIPAVELLHKAQFTAKQGTGALVVAPTRELALQIYSVAQELCSHGHHSQTYGLVMGGANRKTEAEKLARGVNLLVATPGRLLDHLQNTRGLVVRNLAIFVMDEADRILEQPGFEDDLRAILKLLPRERQTMLFSATLTTRVQDLVRLSMDAKTAVHVQVGASPQDASPTTASTPTVAGLEQGYVTCPSDQRFLLLFTFLKKNVRTKKIMVFFSSCHSVKFHSELLNYIDVPVQDIHGRQKQVKRTTTFFQFCKSTTGTLLCTDVAARGLDIPKVDWIIQFDPPDDPKEYIHRVGRTARGATGTGRALLFLTPEETGFLRYLQAANVTLNEYEFPTNKVANVQSQLQRLIESNYYLNRAARDAYRSYLLAYASHSQRDIFDVHRLDLQAVGTAFGFTSPPRVHLAFGKDKSRRGGHNKNSSNKKGKWASSGHSFSAENPYGKKNKSDKRQFSY